MAIGDLQCPRDAYTSRTTRPHRLHGLSVTKYATVANPRLAAKEVMDTVEIPTLQSFYLVQKWKTGRHPCRIKLGSHHSNRGHPLLLEMGDGEHKHCRGKVFLPRSHTQKQYAIQQTHTARTYVSINTNKGSNQLPDITVGDPIQQTWHMPMIRAFLKPTMRQPTYNLQKQITTSTSKLSKLLVQFMDSRELNHDKIYHMQNNQITIGIVSKQWG
jgi:hypothetical protein